MEPSFYGEHFACEDWGWWHVGRRRILAATLGAALRSAGLDRADAEWLDVGCGTGGTTSFLGRNRRLVACDVAPEALRYSASRGLRVVRASAERLPFRDASFDVALSLDVLEHHRADAAVAREVFRVLRPGGLLLATVPAFAFLWGPHDELVHHHRRYRLAELVGVLAGAGFEVRRATYFNVALFPIAALVQGLRRLVRGSRRPRPANDNPQRMPRLVNAALRAMVTAEAPWVARHRMPWGISALAVAVRPGG